MTSAEKILKDRERQGLGPTVRDPQALDRIAVIMAMPVGDTHVTDVGNVRRPA